MRLSDGVAWAYADHLGILDALAHRDEAAAAAMTRHIAHIHGLAAAYGGHPERGAPMTSSARSTSHHGGNGTTERISRRAALTGVAALAMPVIPRARGRGPTRAGGPWW